MGKPEVATPTRHDGRIVIHFDYDCFYASVFEAENPALKSLPLAVQQKQIIVTCNYEARRRGLHKLQLIVEAKKRCPDVIIVLGEDLTRFRDASKELYNFIRAYVWSHKAERLGFDEVFLDVTDMIDYNVDILNHNDLLNSFFHLDKSDPTTGFSYDASVINGYTFPATPAHPISPPSSTPTSPAQESTDTLDLRLKLSSHLAEYIRHQLEEQKGYTSTVGISTNKLMSKLVGNVNKPKGQTTLMPPYLPPSDDEESNVTRFIDAHDIGKIPGVGCKIDQKLRRHVLGREPVYDVGLIYGGTKERVTVRDVRLHPSMGPELLEAVLGGPGSHKGIGGKIWGLINGVDDAEVGKARNVPRQISIEDSYVRLDTMEEVKRELRMLAGSLIKRMHIDLTELDDDDPPSKDEVVPGDDTSDAPRRWLAHPRTLRLTTRPRPPLSADGTRTRSFNRISRSGPMPNFVFSFSENRDVLVEKLVQEFLIPSFRKLHPEKSGWNLSLVNLGATNMLETATDTKDGDRDIKKLFKNQDDVLKHWKVEDKDVPPSPGSPSKPVVTPPDLARNGSEDTIAFTQDSDMHEDAWEESEEREIGETCEVCGAVFPSFAMHSHRLFHTLPD